MANISNPSNPLTPWSTAAVNLPDHANNKIHTDEGARAAGFERALVAGTTIYAYMTHPAVAAWGTDWLGHGGGELRLRQPVFDGDMVDCLVSSEVVSSEVVSSEVVSSDVVSSGDEGPIIEATVDGQARASLALWHRVQAPALRDGDAMDPFDVTLTEQHLDYGMRCGDDLTLYAEQNIAHPVTWANLANSVFIQNLVTGPWIHVRSKIYHQGLATLGSQIHIESRLLDRFDSRAGERALVDMSVFANGDPVATIEHEAIIVLAN